MKGIKKMISFNRSTIEQIKGWTPPKVSLGKSCYVSFSAFDPVSGKLKRKKIMLDHLRTKAEMKRYGARVVKQLTEKLLEGWNPWVAETHPLGYEKFDDVAEKYHDYVMKQLESHDMREQSVASYLSSLNILRSWAKGNITYVYQLDRRNVSAFLDYVYIERNNKLQTRNNYLSWLKVFCRWLLERGYIEHDPTESMKAIERRGKKDRDVMPDSILIEVKQYLEKHNKHYLLACYLLHYCFIRPHEMSLLKLRDFSLSKQTVFLHGEISKNHNDATVTLPAHVIRLMVELRVFDSPDDYFLFSTKDFRPGHEQRSEKTFRDYWIRHVRKDLNLPAQYKFYSLKDTGITNMLRAKKDVLSVRDQARHSSIAITDIYTPKDIQEANELLKNYEGVF